MGGFSQYLTDVDSQVANAFNAIANAEGSNPKYNNPLDLAEGDQGYGTFGAGITIFPTVQAGVDAAKNQLSLMESGSSQVYSPNDSIAAVASKYAPGAQSTGWASNVAKFLGVGTDSPLFPSTAAALGGTDTAVTASSLVSGAVSAATGGAANTIAGYLAQYLGRAIAILLGLLLIAAGVFSFDRVQTIAVGAGKEFGKASLL